MLHALRAELDYARPYILGGLGIALAVTALVSVVFSLASDASSHAVAGIRAMFLAMAPLIVGFIIQGYRSEEKRNRLLILGTSTPRQMALVAALLTVILAGIGIVASGLVLAIGALISGSFAFQSLRLVSYVGVMLFMGLHFSLLIQESSAARRQGRRQAARAGWLGVIASSALYTLMTVTSVLEMSTWLHLFLSNLIIAVGAMSLHIWLFSGRTDFTS